MKRILPLLLWFCCSSVWAVEDYVWTTPSHNSTESMPLGGGDIGMNVWVDAADNAIHCYVSQSGWFDENNTLLKAGALRIMPQDASEPFVEQRLHLQQGYMTIQYLHTKVVLRVDVMKPVVHIMANGPIQVNYDSWREEDKPIHRVTNQQSSWKWIMPAGCKTHKDHIERKANGEVLFWHQNDDETIFDYVVTQQKLDAYHDSIYNPLKNRIMGGALKHHTDNYWQLTLCCQQSTLDQWRSALSRIQHSTDVSVDIPATEQWWEKFWERSFVRSNGKAKRALRNYELFRYMYACNAHPAKSGERWPTKINGGLFTFAPADCDSTINSFETKTPGISTPDYRRWGGGVQTAQNQRLLYWPMLQTGDWDALQGQLDFYSRIIPTAELRSRVYWNHRGTCFTEQMENYGLPNPAEYGKANPDPGLENNRWLEYEWETQLEFADIYCNLPFQYSPLGKKKAAREARRMIIGSLRFFDEHFTEIDSLGHKVYYPSSACETYKITRNSTTYVSGIKRLCMDALKRRRELGLSSNEEEWIQQMLQQLPPIPTYLQEGVTCLAPAETWDRIQNTETPQLYPVWPWRVADKQLGINTYQNDSIAIKHHLHIGWKQYNIWAAYLGMTEEAWNLTMRKLDVTRPEKGSNIYRFPAFWGPGFDWMPDFNWGGSAMIGLHAMLMQEDEDGNIILLPAWPKDEDVHFRLWASNRRLVEVKYRNGNIISYTINGKKQKL